MIPAILSCLFVLYLYRTLNSQSSIENNEDSNSMMNTEADVNDLVVRLQAVSNRLHRMSESKHGGEE